MPFVTKLNKNKVLKNISRYSPENSFNFLYRAVFLNNAFFTIPYYNMEQAFPDKKVAQPSDIPPSYKTKIQDGAVLPSSKKNFLPAYQFVQNASLPSQSKSFILDILNRTSHLKGPCFALNW